MKTLQHGPMLKHEFPSQDRIGNCHLQFSLSNYFYWAATVGIFIPYNIPPMAYDNFFKTRLVNTVFFYQLIHQGMEWLRLTKSGTTTNIWERAKAGNQALCRSVKLHTDRVIALQAQASEVCKSGFSKRTSTNMNICSKKREIPISWRTYQIRLSELVKGPKLKTLQLKCRKRPSIRDNASSILLITQDWKILAALNIKLFSVLSSCKKNLLIIECWFLMFYVAFLCKSPQRSQVQWSQLIHWKI